MPTCGDVSRKMTFIFLGSWGSLAIGAARWPAHVAFGVLEMQARKARRVVAGLWLWVNYIATLRICMEGIV